MISLITQIIIIVLFLTFSFGPAFFALINTAIKHGYKTGVMLATGVVLSDFLLCLSIIFLVHYGATSVIQDDKNQRFMGILAGTILIIFGSLYFRKNVQKSTETIEIKQPSTISMILKGFFLNILNPAVWIIWLGNVTAVSKSLDYSLFKMISFFSVTLGLVWLVEVAKVSAASKLNKLLTEKIMTTINRITGFLLISFGVLLIYKHYFIE
ncbi:MAG: LysE family translocator [Bacteroidota bacterium]|nr:LysE family transporter [Bacteroidota bacterium]MCA6444118.1 LysE family transporter [Bacteroidota bacterium]